MNQKQKNFDVERTTAESTPNRVGWGLKLILLAKYLP